MQIFIGVLVYLAIGVVLMWLTRAEGDIAKRVIIFGWPVVFIFVAGIIANRRLSGK